MKIRTIMRYDFNPIQVPKIEKTGYTEFWRELKQQKCKISVSTTLENSLAAF